MALNISLDQFQSISDGKFNAGQVGVEVKKDGSVALKKLNAHVHFTSLNTATVDPAQTLEIKEAFVKRSPRSASPLGFRRTTQTHAR